MFSILSRRLYPEKIGFWVWVLDWVLYSNPNQKPKKFYTQIQNQKNFVPKHKPKTKKILYPNPKPKPKTQNPKIFIANPKPKPRTKKYLYPNPKPKSKHFLGTNV